MTHNHRFYLLICAFAAMIIWGCSPTKQSAKFTHKALKADTATAVGIFHDLYPCVTGKILTIRKDSIVSHTDTLIQKIDSIVKADCPDGSIIQINCHTKTITLHKVDTVFKTITITQQVKDSAEIYLIAKELATANDTIAVNKRWRRFNFTWALIATGLLLIAIIVIILQVKRKAS